MKFLALMIMVGIVAVGVFFGLNKFAGTGTHAAPTATTAATSGAEAQPTAGATATASEPASQADASQPAANAAPATADTTSSAADSKDVDQDDLCDADKAAPATAPTATPNSSDSAGAPAVSTAESGTATAESATPAATAPAVAETAAPATTVAEAPATTAPAEAPAAAEPAPAPEAAPAPAPKAAPEPAKAAPAVKTRPTAHAAKSAKAAPPPAVHQHITPSPLIKPAAPAIWWTQGATANQGFTLSFAGEASFKKAIVLLFSQPVDAASAAAIRVVGKDGAPVSGSWTASPKNPDLLVFEAPAGTYVLTVPTTLKSTQGTALGRTFGGPLTIH